MRWTYLKSLDIRNAHFNGIVSAIESALLLSDEIKKGKNGKILAS